MEVHDKFSYLKKDDHEQVAWVILQKPMEVSVETLSEQLC